MYECETIRFTVCCPFPSASFVVNSGEISAGLSPFSHYVGYTLSSKPKPHSREHYAVTPRSFARLVAFKLIGFYTAIYDLTVCRKAVRSGGDLEVFPRPPRSSIQLVQNQVLLYQLPSFTSALFSGIYANVLTRPPLGCVSVSFISLFYSRG